MNVVSTWTLKCSPETGGSPWLEAPYFDSAEGIT